MPKIATQVVVTPEEPTVGKTYKIESVDKIKTQQQGWEGYRVDMKAKNGDEAGTVLWCREQAGSKSKLGCFLVVLGNDTDKWLGKNIEIVQWRERNREIRLAVPS